MSENRRTALVTGSSGGIGAAAAIKLASDGYNIALNCRNEEKLPLCSDLAEKCRAFGVRCRCFAADVSVYEECEMFTELAIESFGSIDVLVNNAGISMMSSMLQTSPADYERLIQQNQSSVFYMMQLCGRHMCSRQYGRIINISSYTGIYGGFGVFAYSAAKGAVAAMTRSAAKELAAYNITVNAIAPGMIMTDMLTGKEDDQKKSFESQRKNYEKQTYSKRLGTPEEAAAVITFLASEQASYVTGQVIEVSGGILK